jgi:hypothetical protein
MLCRRFFAAASKTNPGFAQKRYLPAMRPPVFRKHTRAAAPQRIAARTAESNNNLKQKYERKSFFNSELPLLRDFEELFEGQENKI